MKTLLAVTTIALTLAASAVTAQAQGPIPPGRGGQFPGREFSPAYRGYGPVGPVGPNFGPNYYHQHRGPYVVVPDARFQPPPPPPYCPPPVRRGPPLAGILRFIFER